MQWTHCTCTTTTLRKPSARWSPPRDPCCAETRWRSGQLLKPISLRRRLRNTARTSMTSGRTLWVMNSFISCMLCQIREHFFWLCAISHNIAEFRGSSYSVCGNTYFWVPWVHKHGFCIIFVLRELKLILICNSKTISLWLSLQPGADWMQALELCHAESPRIMPCRTFYFLSVHFTLCTVWVRSFII